MIRQVSQLEEWANVASHSLGALLSLVGAGLLLTQIKIHLTPQQWLALILFCTSLFCLYLCSSLYHAAKDEARKKFLHILDHASIFLLIAGTYSAYANLTPKQDSLILLTSIWSCALVGIVSKIFWTGRWPWLSTLLYLLMGWMILLQKQVYLQVPPLSRSFLLYGGLSYSLGCVFYLWRRLHFHHCIWHLWVLAGSTLHYLGLWVYFA